MECLACREGTAGEIANVISCFETTPCFLFPHEVGEDQEGGFQRVVADAPALVQTEDVVLDDAGLHGLDLLAVELHHGFVLGGEVDVLDLLVDAGVVGQYQIHPPPLQVAVDLPQMVADLIAVRLPRLGHQVADVEDRSFGLADGLDHLLRDQVRQDACVEAAGAENDEVTVQDPGDDLFTHMHVVVVAQALDVADVAADLGLAVEVFAGSAPLAH